MKFKNFSRVFNQPVLWSIIAFIIVGLLVIFIIYSFSTRIIENRVVNDLQVRTALILDMIKSSYKEVIATNENLSDFFISYLPSAELTLDTTRTVMVGNTETPILKSKQETLNLSYDYVNQFNQKTGAHASLYVKTDNRFVCISTSFRENKSPAIGRCIGFQDSTFQTLAKGLDVGVKQYLYGTHYIIYTRPVFDEKEKVVGVVSIATDFTLNFQAIKEKIRSTSIGETGYAFVLDASEGKDYGDLIIHPNRENKNVLNETDKHGEYYIKEILNRKNGSIQYHWQSPSLDDNTSIKKLAVFNAFPAWEWIVVVTIYYQEVVHGSIFIIGGLIAFVLLVGGIALWFYKMEL